MNNKPDSERESENKNWQGVDKDPIDEKQNGEKVTKNDLKAKKVDADPEVEMRKEKNMNPQN